ncbi:MAG TPA: histidine kinase dimerization/phosphoacceptor domain -containing protein, partial [Kofleriaceae bacterium]|nr:histidine kinase dimerization/phosphoacceptor domain -containing protein [Kofleriaceae bacterium]
VQRGGALAGHAATLIGYHGLVDEALAGIDRRAVSLEVVDGEGAGGPVLYADAARASGEISRVVTLAVADRRWRVTIASAGGSTGRGWASWLVMAGGLSLLGGLGGVLLGVTGRAARAAALEREQDFLLRAGDAMRACQRDADVRAVTTRWLGERLAADQCFFTEVDLEQDRVTVLPGYHRGRPAAGTYRISSLAPATQTDLRAGRTVAIGDTAADPRTAPRYEQAYAPGGFRAQLGVPLLVDGVWRATLWVISSTPRAWELGELALVQSLAERAWFWVRHLRATDELERRVGERTRALEVSLREKDVLLREIHHRVKNNLQVISSLLYMQAQKSGDPRLAESLGESRERVQSIALVHDQLYRAASDAASIDLGQYLDELVRSLARAQRNPRVRVAVHADALLLPLDQAVSCGLIVNELISNALKHAFPGERAGTVTIEAHGDEGRAVVSVRDDGVGLPAGFEPSARARTGLGMVVVTTLASQLHATLTVVREPDTAFELRFPIEWTVRPA